MGEVEHRFQSSMASIGVPKATSLNIPLIDDHYQTERIVGELGYRHRHDRVVGKVEMSI